MDLAIKVLEFVFDFIFKTLYFIVSAVFTLTAIAYAVFGCYLLFEFYEFKDFW